MFLLVPRCATAGDVPKPVLAALGRLIFLNTRNLDDPLLGVDARGINADLSIQGYSVREHPASSVLTFNNLLGRDYQGAHSPLSLPRMQGMNRSKMENGCHTACCWTSSACNGRKWLSIPLSDVIALMASSKVVTILSGVQEDRLSRTSPRLSLPPQ
jgi:hypothetical protein